MVSETAGGSTNLTGELEYRLNGGAWTYVSATTPVQMADSANVTDGAATTQQIGSGTFVAGAIEEDNGGSTSSMSGNSSTEFEFVLQIDGAQVTPGSDAIELRVTDNGSALTTYTNIPTVTPSAGLQAGGGNFSDSDTHSGGTVSPGGVDVAGGDFSDPDTLSGGDAVLNVGGGGASDADTMSGGAASQPISAGGGAAGDADEFGGGQALPGPVAVAGLHVADPDAIGGGSIAVNLGNALLADPDVFFGGRTTLNVAGILIADGDLFGGGAGVEGGVAVSGSLVVDPDTFSGGAASQGGAPQGVSGGGFEEADSFGGGQAVPAAVAVSGTLYIDPDTLRGGSGTPGSVEVSGGNVDDADTISGGVAVHGAVGAGGGGLIDPETVSGGRIALNVAGVLIVDPDQFGGGVATQDGSVPVVVSLTETISTGVRRRLIPLMPAEARCRTRIKSMVAWQRRMAR